MLEERIGRLKLAASPGAFLQVNTPACEEFYEQVRAQLQADGFKPDRVVIHRLKLCPCGCGADLRKLPLLRHDVYFR